VRIVVPHVDGMLRPETVEALEASGRPYEMFRLSILDDEAYGRAFRGWWTDGRTFCVVEQDNAPTAAQLDALEQCAGFHCSVPYRYMGKETADGLGCTKFTRGLIAAFPHAADRAMETGTRPQRTAKWYQVDMGIYSYLSIVGVGNHVHREHGLCVHLHEWPELTERGYGA
jgi:hypothetical protein